MADVPEDVQRWTAKRRVALVLRIVRGEMSVAEAARKHGLTVAEIEDGQERFLAAAENALRSRPKDEEAFKDDTPSPALFQQARGAPQLFKPRQRPNSISLITFEARPRVGTTSRDRPGTSAT
jgi:hypothetical protein